MNLELKQWITGLVEAFLVGGTSSFTASFIDVDFSIYHRKFWELALASAVMKMGLYIQNTLSRNKDVQAALMTPPPK